MLANSAKTCCHCWDGKSSIDLPSVREKQYFFFFESHHFFKNSGIMTLIFGLTPQHVGLSPNQGSNLHPCTGRQSLNHWTTREVSREKHNFLVECYLEVLFSRSVVSDSLWPHEPQHTRPPCPSPTPRVYPNPCPSSRWCHPTISSSVVPFSSCPQPFPASGPFQMRSVLGVHWKDWCWS